jgi:hypothetical protein
MNLVYKYLFTVELLHHYYRDGKCPDFEMVPTEDCLQQMRDSHLLWRVINNKLFVGIEIDPADPGEKMPAVPLRDGLVFRFYLKLKNASFLNFTNLPAGQSKNQCYYFSNLSGNKQAKNLYLSSAADAFDNAVSYSPGDIVQGGAQLFECISPAKGKATSNGSFWKNIGADRVVTQNDLIALTTASYKSAVIPPSGTVASSVFKLNRETNLYDVPALGTVVSNFTGPQSATTVNLFSLQEGNQKLLSPGRYLVSVNGVPDEVYFDTKAVSSGIFGVIDIFHHAGVPADFNLLDNGTVKEAAYKICFHNRSTIWKYILKNDSTLKVTDKNAAISFSKEATGTAFHSDMPLALSQTAIDTLQIVDASNNVVHSPVKNAPVDTLKKITINKTEFFCSEIFLNY